MSSPRSGITSFIYSTLDRFREEHPNARLPGTNLGLLVSFLMVTLLAVYLGVLLQTNPIVIETSILGFTDARIYGSLSCAAPGGCLAFSVNNYNGASNRLFDTLTPFIPNGGAFAWRKTSSYALDTALPLSGTNTNSRQNKLILVAAVSDASPAALFYASPWLLDRPEFRFTQNLYEFNYLYTYANPSNPFPLPIALGPGSTDPIFLTAGRIQLRKFDQFQLGQGNRGSQVLEVYFDRSVTPGQSVPLLNDWSTSGVSTYSTTELSQQTAAKLNCSNLQLTAATGNYTCVAMEFSIDPTLFILRQNVKYSTLELLAQVGGNYSIILTILGVLMSIVRSILSPKSAGKADELSSGLQPSSLELNPMNSQ